MKRPSLKLRITGWFALMMFVIEGLVLAFLLAVNGTVATNDPEARLVRMVEHNANRVKYNNRQFRFSRIHYNRSGVYTVLYDADGNVLQGTFPAEFTPAEPLPLGSETVRLVDCGDNEYYVYDVRVDMMVGSVWLRGVIDADANGGVMRVILPLAWSLLPVLLVLSVIGGYFIASRALRPVRQLTAAANAISDGQDLKARIGLPHTSGSDEIYQLSASFDNMFDRLERSFEAEQRFTSDASHELRTPTTVILAACEDARKNAQTPADYQAALDVIDRQAHKMSALIRSMLEITRLDQGTQKVNWEYADLSDLVTVICDEQAMVARRGIRISCAAEPGIFIDMDVFLISRVVQNLLDNAFKFGVAWAKKVFPNETKARAVEKLWEAILHTCRVDDDPIAAWNAHNADLQARCDHLNSLGIASLEYHASNGTNLTVGMIPEAQFCGGGEYTIGGSYFNPNLPTEECFISPKRGEAEGIVYSSKPLSYQGQLIEDFSIRFEHGRAVEAHARTNEALLQKLIAMDEGSAYLGECALVPYDSPINQTGILFYNTLFDENACCHLALGMGFIDTIRDYPNRTLEEMRALGVNDSMIHEDFMIGTPDLSVTAHCRDGRTVPVFRDGTWAF